MIRSDICTNHCSTLLLLLLLLLMLLLFWLLLRSFDAAATILLLLLLLQQQQEIVRVWKPRALRARCTSGEQHAVGSHSATTVAASASRTSCCRAGGVAAGDP